MSKINADLFDYAEHMKLPEAADFPGEDILVKFLLSQNLRRELHNNESISKTIDAMESNTGRAGAGDQAAHSLVLL